MNAPPVHFLFSVGLHYQTYTSHFRETGGRARPRITKKHVLPLERRLTIFMQGIFNEGSLQRVSHFQQFLILAYCTAAPVGFHGADNTDIQTSTPGVLIFQRCMFVASALFS